MTHYNLVHKFIPMPQAMKIPNAEAAVDKEWKKLETIPASQLDKVKSNKEVILESQRDKKKVHFATSMDTCHLKNAELEPTIPKYKGRVVLRGEIVKDDSGACAVFTEQGSFAFHMIAAKVMDVIAGLPVCDEHNKQPTRYLLTFRKIERMPEDSSEFLSQNVQANVQ